MPPGCTAACRLIVQPLILGVHVTTTIETLSVKGGTIEREMACNLAESSDFHAFFRDLLLAANLRRGTDGFTSPPKGRHAEDFFFALKNRTVLAGFEPMKLGTRASTVSF
jgi:hypothetical protein